MDENMQLCRICISNSECATMIPIFGEDLLWKKITMLADVKVEKGDTLPQQVCMVCAKSVIGACMFKKKCEDADNFFRHHLQMMRKMEQFQRGDGGVADVITISEGSDNDPNDDNMNLVNRHLMTGSNTGLQLMNGNNLSSSVGGSGGALLEQQIDNKNSYEMNSVRMMMNNFLLEQQSKEADAMAAVNGYQNEGEFAAPCDASMDDDQLPLIPEIELITPNDDGGTVMDRQHIVNSQQQGYQCSICYQIFVRKFLLKEHMQSCHGRSPPVYECTNCKKSYLYKRFLEKHIRRGRCVKKRRNQTRPMECTDCHVLFPTGHHLGWHKRTGCPSRASKVPLQQIFKQNIVQYNNFPKPVIPPRKPDNALYMQNRRILPNTSKRKGRTRIKLDAKKIALAKILILKEATTTQIAQELEISRTFAWRLRKNLVNGVSLHERFVDQQSSEEKQDSIPKAAAVIPEETKPPTEEVNFDVKVEQNEEKEHTNAESTVVIKQEVQDDDEEEEDDENDDDDSDDDDDESDSDSDSDSESDSDDDEDEDDDDEDEQEEEQNKNSSEQINQQRDELLASQEQNYHCSYTNDANNQMQQQIEQSNYNGVQQTAPNIETPASNQMNMHNENAESDSEDEDGDDNEDDDDDDDDEDEDSEEEGEGEADEVENSEAQLQKYKQHLMQTLPSVFHIPQPGFPQPVNLSIKSMQPQTTNLTPTTKKPRKPNVFIDDEKYATAKILVSQNSSTMEIARQLNVSQMTAWKLRDAIVKGIPLSYRSKRETRPKADKQKPEASSTPKEKLPRRRLKAAEREQRDREITREILEMIKEDSNIQYWKVSAKLAEKGFAISPSSVCQKLKSLGIHRRWKPGDKPPILDMDSLKTNSSIVGVGIGGGASGGGGFGRGTSTDSFDFNNEHQFELGGAHFLSAFTH